MTELSVLAIVGVIVTLLETVLVLVMTTFVRPKVRLSSPSYISELHRERQLENGWSDETSDKDCGEDCLQVVSGSDGTKRVRLVCVNVICSTRCKHRSSCEHWFHDQTGRYWGLNALSATVPEHQCEASSVQPKPPSQLSKWCGPSPSNSEVESSWASRRQSFCSFCLP